MQCGILRERYEARVTEYADSVACAFRAGGYTVSELYVDDLDGDLRWELFINEDDAEPIVWTMAIIGSDNGWDAPDEDGVNWMVDLVEDGGRMLGSIIPGNYTNDVWVNPEDLPEMDRRLHDILRCPAEEWVERAA